MKRDVTVSVYVTIEDGYMEPLPNNPKKSKLQVALVKAVAAGEWEVTDDEPHYTGSREAKQAEKE